MAKRDSGTSVRNPQEQRPADALARLRAPGAAPERASAVVFRSATSDFSAPPARREGLPPLDERDADAPEHRQFPRALLQVRVEAWIDEGRQRRFSAIFLSENLSVSGAFLSSTFFLPVGTELRVRFDLETGEGPVEARAVIMREERSEARSGFGLRFEEFYGQSEVTLAKLFLVTQLRTFATEYLQSPRAGSITGELDRLVDALAAWELLKVANPRDTWRGG